MYQCANGEFLKLSKDAVIFGEIISGVFFMSATAAIGIPQFANGPLFTSFIVVPEKITNIGRILDSDPPSVKFWSNKRRKLI